MTLRQAKMRLVALGFVMNNEGKCVWGRTKAEKFDYSPHHILSEPFRDVFVGECNGGWYITSHINFKAKRLHARYDHQATILNIFGKGKTLDEAMADFIQNFQKKQYNGYGAVDLEGATSKSIVGAAVLT